MGRITKKQARRAREPRSRFPENDWGLMPAPKTKMRVEVKLTKEEERIRSEPVNPDDVRIKPSGQKP